MQLPKELTDKLPQDFDWEYYISANRDIAIAGINTEIQAIAHYIAFGRKEQRIYSANQGLDIINAVSSLNTSLSQSSKFCNKIILFVQWYKPNDPETLLNITRCLENNVNNKFLHKICLLLDKHTTQKDVPAHLRSNDKIEIHYMNLRLSYKHWILLANEKYSEYIKILSNTDIYFDNTIQILFSQYFNENTMYSITRKDLDLDNNIVQSYDTYGDKKTPTNPLYSQDCWIYRNILNNSLDLNNINYQLGVGNCDRIFKKKLAEAKINLINLYPEVNAIHIDRRTSRNRKSYPLLEHNLEDMNTYNVQRYLTYEDLKTSKRELQSCTLLLTGKEIENGQYDIFTDRLAESLRSTPENIEYTKAIDFNIITQQSGIHIEKIQNYFNKVNIIDINIPKQYDHYIAEEVDPIYGKVVGPNYTFFKIIQDQRLFTYNTSLFLECDVFFNGLWAKNISQYCELNQFWISGSKNMGYHKQKLDSIHYQHLNGGVCLYATGDPCFRSFIDFCHNMSPVYVAKYSSHIPYDYIIYKTIEDFFNYDGQNFKLWQYIHHQYQYNSLIHNLSSPLDASIDEYEYQRLYPLSILHKKDKPKS